MPEPSVSPIAIYQLRVVREELRNLAPLGELQAAHAAALERQFADWEQRWRECRECL